MTSNHETYSKSKKLTVPVNIGSDHIRGSINAPITIVEYGDYECPYTGMAYPVVKV
jgi:protein-disulfide isomerase